MNRFHTLATAALVLAAGSVSSAAQTDSDARAERVFRSCAACHSLEPGKNMTGPTLAELWNRKAGGLASFMRYSPALKSSGIIWDDQTLDAWLKDPPHFIPGNTITFPGVKDARQRADLLAFLKDATQPGRTPPATAQQAGQMGGMMGMMGGGAAPDLKKLDPEKRVQAIAHCKDTYRVTTADGKTRDFWERNLRFKTDVSEDGPQKGAPLAAYNLPLQARLLRSRRWAVCIIATNVAPRELLWRPNRRTRFGVGALPFYNCIARMQWRPEPMYGAQVAAAANVLFD